jgi:hypothetical protein
MPGMMQTTFPWEILETPGQGDHQEAFNQVRRIFLNVPRRHRRTPKPRYAGHSAGRWDGTSY